jgi:hypothetical protein
MFDRIHPIYPCVHLQFVGVLSGYQGHGGALLKHGLARTDAADQAVYLETSNPDNLPLYLRHGFEIKSEQRLGRNGPTLWAIPRPARRRAMTICGEACKHTPSPRSPDALAKLRYDR